jgi:hypothetical protein
MAQPRLYVVDGGLYIGDTPQGRPVTQNDEDKKYRDAYRRLFGLLKEWPPDGVYIFTKGEMAPTAANRCFQSYLAKVNKMPGRKWMGIRRELR